MDIKDKVIAEYLCTGCGCRLLQHKYGIGRATICNWVQVYQGIHGIPPARRSFPLCKTLTVGLRLRSKRKPRLCRVFKNYY